jgi:hypothetical protein
LLRNQHRCVVCLLAALRSSLRDHGQWQFAFGLDAYPGVPKFGFASSGTGTAQILFRIDAYIPARRQRDMWSGAHSHIRVKFLDPRRGLWREVAKIKVHRR